MNTYRILCGDVREKLAEIESGSVQTCVTSPPYFGLRDYGHDGQIGLEATPEAFVAAMVSVFGEVGRALKDDGTLWLNLGDSYAGSGKGGNPVDSPYAGFHGNKEREKAAQPRNGKQLLYGHKQKDLIGIPWMVAFALRSAGWYLRCDVIWSKPNPMPESVTDRPTKAHEYVFLLSKAARYFYDADAIKEPYSPESLARYAYPFGQGDKAQERLAQGLRTTPSGMREYKGQARKDYEAAGAQNPSDTKRRILESMEEGQGRNARSVWTINTSPYPGAHFATFPEELPTRCILAGSRPGDLVLDPFTGSGTTGAVALKLGRSFVGCELNPAYVELAQKRIASAAPLFSQEIA